MSFIAILDQIKCCKEKDYDHIVKEPIELNCGHSICKKCFLIENNKTVYCVKSEVETNLKNQNKENTAIKLLMRSVLSELFQTIHKDTKEKLDILKRNFFFFKTF